MRVARGIRFGFGGGKYSASSVDIESVNESRLWLDTYKVGKTSRVIGYPMIKIVRYRVKNIINFGGVSRGYEISYDVYTF